jgi:hypothetical protein
MVENPALPARVPAAELPLRREQSPHLLPRAAPWAGRVSQLVLAEDLAISMLFGRPSAIPAFLTPIGTPYQPRFLSHSNLWYRNKPREAL